MEEGCACKHCRIGILKYSIKKKSLNPYEEIASFVFNICPKKTSILNVCPLKSLYGIHLHPSLGLPAQRVIWVCEPTSG